MKSIFKRVTVVFLSRITKILENATIPQICNPIIKLCLKFIEKSLIKLWELSERLHSRLCTTILCACIILGIIIICRWDVALGLAISGTGIIIGIIGSYFGMKKSLATTKPV